MHIKQKLKDICKRYNIADLYVFGSRAKEILAMVNDQAFSSSKIIQKRLIESKLDYLAARINEARENCSRGMQNPDPLKNLWRIWKMIEVVWDQGFKRSYRKKISRVPHLMKREISANWNSKQSLRQHSICGVSWSFKLKIVITALELLMAMITNIACASWLLPFSPNNIKQ